MVVGSGFAFSEDGKFHVVQADVVGIRRLAIQELKPLIAEGNEESSEAIEAYNVYLHVSPDRPYITPPAHYPPPFFRQNILHRQLHTLP